MITIVKPVVRSEKEVTIAEVLEERLIHELKMDKNAKSNAEELVKTYRQSGTELSRCRLKATLYYMGRKVSEGISDMDIIDSGDKVSHFTIYSWAADQQDEGSPVFMGQQTSRMRGALYSWASRPAG